MTSNKKYSAIVFDLGNVLIPFDLNIFINKINKLQPGLGDKFINFFRSNYELHREFERGNIPEKEFIEKMLGVLENKIDAETFCIEYADIFLVNEEVASLLPQLKKNYKLYLLSNTDSIHQKYGWQKYNFLKHFDKQILSHEVGAVKPEEKIYRAVEAASGFHSEKHFFIDDIDEYVEGAKRIGWDAVQFVSYQKLVADLKEREIL
jgi:putative hydrolase of the HAD superfamily